jgi:hypothetical protein
MEGIKQTPQFSPHPWLRFYCPAYLQIGELDFRKIDRCLDATIESLIPALSCRRCCRGSPNSWVSRQRGSSDACAGE